MITLILFVLFRPSTAPTTTVKVSSASTSSTSRISSAAKPIVKTQTNPSSTATSSPSSMLAKTKSNSSSNLYHARDATKAVAVGKPSTDLRQNRVSLVARQTRFSTGTQPFNNVKTSGLMTRSATSATLSNRGRVVAFGRGAVLSSAATSRGAVQPRPHSASHPQSWLVVGYYLNYYQLSLKCFNCQFTKLLHKLICETVSLTF